MVDVVVEFFISGLEVKRSDDGRLWYPGKGPKISHWRRRHRGSWRKETWRPSHSRNMYIRVRLDTKLSNTYRSGNGLKGLAFSVVLSLIRKSFSEGAKNQLWCVAGKAVVSGRV